MFLIFSIHPIYAVKVRDPSGSSVTGIVPTNAYPCGRTPIGGQVVVECGVGKYSFVCFAINSVVLPSSEQTCIRFLQIDEQVHTRSNLTIGAVVRSFELNDGFVAILVCIFPCQVLPFYLLFALLCMCSGAVTAYLSRPLSSIQIFTYFFVIMLKT